MSHTASRTNPPSECFESKCEECEKRAGMGVINGRRLCIDCSDIALSKALSPVEALERPCEVCDGYGVTDLCTMNDCPMCGGTGTATSVDPETLKATIRQMHEALRMALRDWPLRDVCGAPRFYNPGDYDRIVKIRAACEAADKLPRSVRG